MFGLWFIVCDKILWYEVCTWQGAYSIAIGDSQSYECYTTTVAMVVIDCEAGQVVWVSYGDMTARVMEVLTVRRYPPVICTTVGNKDQMQYLWSTL